MGTLLGTNLPKQRKDPVITSIFATEIPQNGFSAPTPLLETENWYFSQQASYYVDTAIRT
jgi:hypothetical protein